MTALASTDITITIEERRIYGKHRRNRVKIVFGDSALTIPSGGVPLPTFASFGMVRNLDFLTVFDQNSASGYLWKYDKTNNKLRAYRSAGFTPAGTNDTPAFTGSALGNHTHNILLKNAAVADGATTRVNAGANLLGANTGGDLTITGAGANGGVVNASAGTPAGTVAAPVFTGTAVAAGVLLEDTSSAPAAQTLYAEAVGW